MLVDCRFFFSSTPSSPTSPCLGMILFCHIVGKLPSGHDREITHFRENNTVIRHRLLQTACSVCSVKGPMSDWHKDSLYMIYMHLWETYWAQLASSKCFSIPINGLTNYFDARPIAGAVIDACNIACLEQILMHLDLKATRSVRKILCVCVGFSLGVSLDV